MVPSPTFSDELWDKFEVVCKKVSHGKNFTGTVAAFLQKRAQIEREYAKSLAKLCKDKMFNGENEIGSSKDCWQLIRDNLEAMANKHEALVGETNNLYETIQTYLTEARGFRKTLVANGDKVTKELRAAERKETTARQNYEKLKKAQEESEEEANKASGSAKEAKAKKSAEVATKKAETADFEYRDAVKQLQGSQQKFYNDEMPKYLDDLQKLEEERIDKMKDWFLRLVSLQEKIPHAVNDACKGMRTAADAIDRANDISQFISQNKSGTPKPPEAKYEPYVSESPMLSREGSRRTLSPSGSGNLVNRQSSAFGFNANSSVHTKSPEPVTSAPIISTHVSTTATASNANSSPRMVRTVVRALYNYDATEDNELSFKANDKIVVIQKDDSGWWHGELNGQVGIFPSNFVETGDAASAVAATGGGGGGSGGGSGGGGGGGAKDDSKTPSKCKVLYDYNADSDSELSIKEGEMLTIENEDEGWYFGTNTKGGTGRFPSNYVQTM